MTRLIVLCAVIVLIAAAAFAVAQVPENPQKPVVPGDVISGNDIGFRLEGGKRGRAVGRLMVRVNGQWLEAQLTSPMDVIPLKK